MSEIKYHCGISPRNITRHLGIRTLFVMMIAIRFQSLSTSHSVSPLSVYREISYLALRALGIEKFPFSPPFHYFQCLVILHMYIELSQTPFIFFHPNPPSIHVGQSDLHLLREFFKWPVVRVKVSRPVYKGFLNRQKKKKSSKSWFCVVMY